MKNNIYMSVPVVELPKLHFILRETLSMMSRIYGDVVLSPCSDLIAFHQTVEAVKSQYDQVLDAMEEFNIVPLKGKSDFQE